MIYAKIRVLVFDNWLTSVSDTTLKMKFFVKDFFSTCEQIRRKLFILTKDLVKRKIHFLCSLMPQQLLYNYIHHIKKILPRKLSTEKITLFLNKFLPPVDCSDPTINTTYPLQKTASWKVLLQIKR